MLQIRNVCPYLHWVFSLTCWILYIFEYHFYVGSMTCNGLFSIACFFTYTIWTFWCTWILKFTISIFLIFISLKKIFAKKCLIVSTRSFILLLFHLNNLSRTGVIKLYNWVYASPDLVCLGKEYVFIVLFCILETWVLLHSPCWLEICDNLPVTASKCWKLQVSITRSCLVC